MSIGMRLKEWREANKLKQPEAASIFGVSPSSYQKYEMEIAAPGSAAMEAFVRAGINANWLLTGDGPMLLADCAGAPADFGADFTLVPQFDVSAGAGAGQLVERELEIGRLAFRRDWIRQKGLSPKDLAIIRVAGDSMSPTIRDGSLVLVDTRQETVGEDGIYVLQRDGHLIAKRLQKDFTGGLFIRSDNPAYQTQQLSVAESQNLYIVGKVVWAGGEM